MNENEWKAGTTYKQGDRVTRDGKTFEALHDLDETVPPPVSGPGTIQPWKEIE